MWKVEIQDKNYNKFTFEFEEIFEASDFVSTIATKVDVKHLSFAILFSEKEGEQNGDNSKTI